MGCGRRAPQQSLLRLALAGARVGLDRDRSVPGRGAYVCDAACAELALRRRALPRAFRRHVETPEDFVESID